MVVYVNDRGLVGIIHMVVVKELRGDDAVSPELSVQLVPALAPGLLAQGIAGNHIARCGDIFLGGAQTLPGVLQTGLGLMVPGGTGGQIAVQLLQALPGEHHALLQCPHVCLTACHICRQIRFPAPKLQKLAGNALGIGCHGRKPLLQLFQPEAFLLHVGFNLGDAASGLVDLGGNAAAAVFLTL